MHFSVGPTVEKFMIAVITRSKQHSKGRELKTRAAGGGGAGGVERERSPLLEVLKISHITALIESPYTRVLSNFEITIKIVCI